MYTYDTMLDSVSLANTDWEWPEIVEVSTKYNLELDQRIPCAHRRLRVLADHTATRGGPAQHIDLTTEVGCSTIYKHVLSHLHCPRQACMLSHGKLGRFGRVTLPPSGPLKNIIDISGLETVVLHSSGQVIGGTKQGII